MNKHNTEVEDKVRELLLGHYACGRVWEAWGVGTMGQEDFSPLEENDDVVNDFVEMITTLLENNTKETIEKINKIKFSGAFLHDGYIYSPKEINDILDLIITEITNND